METDKSVNHPSPDEARRMLDAADQEEQATRNPPLPWRFFIAQAVALAAIFAAQAFPVPWSTGIATLGIISILVVGVRFVYFRPGYGFVAPDGLGAFPYLLALFVGVGVPATLAIGLGVRWWWLAAGAMAAVVTLEMGRRYRKSTGRG
ncbi:MAG: hypothetical protein Q4F67_12740 [Propionibacteriaceae bacterium]|nr:hypothetical protein [Propionibacteriaceae bacterium]